MQEDPCQIKLHLETNVNIGTIYLKMVSQIKLHLETKNIGGDLP